VNAPATMSVIGAKALEVRRRTTTRHPALGAGRQRVTALRARHQHHEPRRLELAATSQLTILDGRTLYQDFFGFTMWDSCR
jgi:hypothetical protein